MNKYHHLEFVEEDEPIARLIERLYLSSTQLPPETGSFYTFADIDRDLEYWILMHPIPTKEQNQLIAETRKILLNVEKKEIDWNQSAFTPTIEVNSGIDYLYHPKNNTLNEDSLYFNVFRDRDYLTKFNERGNLFSIRVKSSYGPYVYVSSQFGLRENWIGLKTKDHHFAKTFHEIDNNFNQHAYGTFRFGPILLNSGRSRTTLGLGKNGKLLIGHELPPLDVFRGSIKFGKYFKFFHYMMPLNNISVEHLSETQLPKYLLAHRVSWDLPPYFRIAASEMMIINSYLKWNYLNPLIVYHNITNADLVNILTSFDIEFVPFKNIKGYLSVAIDEIDFYLIEQESELPRESRIALGLQFGLKIINPCNLNNSQILIEYLSTDRWLYNYQVKNNSKDLTYTFVEKIGFPQTHYFYRFVGHYLGSNVKALFVDFEYGDLTIKLNNINRGNNYILDHENTWDESLPNIIENSTSISLDWEGDIINNKLNINSRIGYSWVDNFHNVKGEKLDYPEIWISLNYSLFLLSDL